jgi:hypothetical protein
MQLALPKSLANPRGANQGYFWWDPPISLHPSHAGSPSRPYPFAWGAARPAALDLRRAKQAAELRQAEQAAGLCHVPGGAVRAGLQDSSAARRYQDSFALATAVRWAMPGLRRPRTSAVRLRFSPSARRPHSYNPYQIMLKS